MKPASAALEAARADSRRALLGSEALLLANLRRSLAIVSSRHGGLARASQELYAMWWGLIRAGRAHARTRSRETLVLEIAAAGGLAEAGGDGAEDGVRAASTAESFSRRWQNLAVNGVSEEEGPLGARGAAEALHSHVEMVAATEAADAFNDERDRALRLVNERVRDPALLLFKVWDAALDRRTCRVCMSMNGTVRPLFVSFPEPMPAHPRCRCVTTVLALPMLFDFEREAA